MVEHSYAPERETRLGTVGYLFLEAVQSLGLPPVFGSDHPAGAVVHTEYEPAGLASLQVRLVAECGDVPADLISIEVLASFLEFDGLVFPVRD